VDIRPVDPRDIEWEASSPAYRVYFWREDSRGGYASEEFQLDGATDVHEVLTWVAENADGRVLTVYALVEVEGGRGLVRLAGVDPTAEPKPAST
jgi:hypothetical protein